MTQADPLLCLPEPLASPPRRVDLQTQENQDKDQDSQEQQHVRVPACLGLCTESKLWVQQKSPPEVHGWVCWGWWGGAEGWKEAGF